MFSKTHTMQNIIRKVSFIAAGCVLVSALNSCTNNSTAGSGNCADSVRMALAAAGVTTTTTTTTTRDTVGGGAGVADTTGNGNGSGNAAANGSSHMSSARGTGREAKTRIMRMELAETDPMLGGHLQVSSPEFGRGGVIPVKYTCDGQGATPPLQVGNIPKGTQSLALIVYDYHASPDGGQTYWLIWNLDTSGVIPENFTNDHEGMNAAHQYGYTPLCGRAGDHRYHFMFYALDCKLVIGKNSTKAAVEGAMRNHILDKGELVGIYNKRIE